MLRSESHLRFSLNNATFPALNWEQLSHVALAAGATGVELRTDVENSLFAQCEPEAVKEKLASNSVELWALAEVSGFNTGSEAVVQKTQKLVELARRSGAHAVVLIPEVNGVQHSFEMLCAALRKLRPIFEDADVKGLIEPVGFEASSLRSFDEARDAIRAIRGEDCFGLVHDTFHFHLGDDNSLSADMVDLVHVSSVTEVVAQEDMRDGDRVLVGSGDRLNSIDQISGLRHQGCHAPISFESFAQRVQRTGDPIAALSASTGFVRSQLVSSGTERPNNAENNAPIGVPDLETCAHRGRT